MTDNEETPDDQLLGELRSALEAVDPVPDDVLAAAKASFTWRTIDAELAELAFDSATDELVGVRSDGDDRRLTFRTPGVEIEVMVQGARRHLTGQLVPPRSATVDLVAEGALRRCEVGQDGVFAFADVPSGPVRLHCSIGETTVITESLVL